MVSRKYTNFFFSSNEECLPVKINTKLPSKIRDTNKRDKHNSKLVPKSSRTAQDAILK